MRNFYFKLILVVFIVVLLLFSNSHVFGAIDDVAVQQDVSAIALRDIETVRNIIASNENLRNALEASATQDLCYAILPSTAEDGVNLRLYVYRKSWVVGTAPDMNYYGITTPAFEVNAYGVYNLYRGAFSNYTYTNVSFSLPAFYYLRSLSDLTSGQSLQSPVVSAVDENTNAVKENTEVSKETQNFIKDDSEVADGEITSMTNSFNDLDDIQDTGAQNLGNIFDLFSNNRNNDATSFVFSVPVPFSDENMTFVVDKDLTRNTLLSLCGGNTGMQSLFITFINFIWSFFIFKFIVTNLISLIDKIRTGDITNIRTRNVLVDVL